MWKKLARICPSTKKRLERFELREKERKQQNRKERNNFFMKGKRREEKQF